MTRRCVIDANIMLALMNKKEEYHNLCVELFREINQQGQDGKPLTILVSPILLFEVNVVIRRRKRNKQWEQPTTSIDALCDLEYYDVTFQLVKKIEGKNLYDTLGNLKGLDAIYAAIAITEGIPLITLDAGFKKIGNDITLYYLPDYQITDLALKILNTDTPKKD